MLLGRLRRKVLAGTLVTAFVVAGVAFGTLYPELRERPQQQLVHEAQLRVGVVERFLAQVDEISRQITSRTAIRQELARYHRGEVDRDALAAFTEDKIADALFEARQVTGITRLDHEDSLIVSVGECIPEAYCVAAGARDQVTLDGPVPVDGQWRLVARAPIHEEGVWLGTDVVLFDIEPLGMLIGATAPAFVSAATTLIAVNQDESHVLYSSADPDWLAAMPIETIVQDGRSAQGKVLQHNGMVTAWAPVSGLSMVVVVSADAGELYAPMHRLLAALAAATLLLVALFTFLLMRDMRPLEAALQFQAEHDPLTRLPNRLLLTYRLRAALQRARRTGRRLALLYLDLDHFKNINDSLGHVTGDTLLQLIGDRIRARTERAETVARIGGDEFILLMEDINEPEDAARLALEVLDLLHKPFEVGSWKDLYVGASVGISLYPDDGTNATQLISNADTAMYRAKEEGRNTYAFYRSEFTVAATERMEMEAQLRGALERNEFELFYQPQINVESGEIDGVEALLRWNHPKQGMIPPGKFIPVAEQSGLIIHIGEWVLREACRQLVQWDREGVPPLRMAVNLSPRQLAASDLTEQIIGIIEESGVDTHRLELEVTESALMEHEREFSLLLFALRSRSVRFAIDDFGTGYSSLAYLKHLDVDHLKIDQSFVQGLPSDERDVAIVESVVDIAHSLNLKVIAEGIEHERQLRFVTEDNWNFWQGFLCSPARPAAEIGAALTSGSRDWREATAFWDRRT